MKSSHAFPPKTTRLIFVYQRLKRTINELESMSGPCLHWTRRGAIKGVAINLASGSDLVTAEGEENVQFPSTLRR